VNVLFLSLDFVYPADRGVRVRTLAQLRALASIGSVERITVLSISDTPVDPALVRALEHDVPKVTAEPPVHQPYSLRRAPRRIPRFLSLRLRGMPYIATLCDAPAMAALVERHLRSGDYDVVYLGHLGMAAYLATARRLAPRARVLLDQHNVEWEIFERLVPSVRQPVRTLVRWEARTLRRFERATLRAVEAVIAISDADAEAFRLLAGVQAVVVPTYIAPAPPRVETTDAPALAYAGMLAWQPNALGLDWFCREVWPVVRRRIPDATLAIAGPGLGRTDDGALAVPEAWRQPGITTVGWVESLETVYRGAVAMVAPIIGGSGVRMKLLESMKAGMPTVTTRDGAAGLAIVDGREMLVADDAAAFADATVRLLSDAALRERLRAAGYAFLDAHHSLAAARRRLEPLLTATAS
jgi:glycosyltransferase involved in cell wall biosynthesis